MAIVRAGGGARHEAGARTSRCLDLRGLAVPVRLRSGRRRSRGDARQCAWKPHITVAPPGPMANRGPRAATFTRGTLNHRHLNIPEPLCKRLGNGFGETTRPACRRCILESAASPVVSQRGSFVIENVGDNGRGCHRRVGGRRLRDRRGYRRSGENGSYGTEYQDSGDDDRSLYAHDSSMAYSDVSSLLHGPRRSARRLCVVPSFRQYWAISYAMLCPSRCVIKMLRSVTYFIFHCLATFMFACRQLYVPDASKDVMQFSTHDALNIRRRGDKVFACRINV